MITSGKKVFVKGSIVLFRRFRQKEATETEHNSQVQKGPMESDATDADGTLHRKPREVCITEDIESIDLEWFENTKRNRAKMALDVRDKWAFATGIHWVRLHR